MLAEKSKKKSKNKKIKVCLNIMNESCLHEQLGPSVATLVFSFCGENVHIFGNSEFLIHLNNTKSWKKQTILKVEKDMNPLN